MAEGKAFDVTYQEIRSLLDHPATSLLRSQNAAMILAPVSKAFSPDWMTSCATLTMFGRLEQAAPLRNKGPRWNKWGKTFVTFLRMSIIQT